MTLGVQNSTIEKETKNKRLREKGKNDYEKKLQEIDNEHFDYNWLQESIIELTRNRRVSSNMLVDEHCRSLLISTTTSI